MIDDSQDEEETGGSSNEKESKESVQDSLTQKQYRKISKDYRLRINSLPHSVLKENNVERKAEIDKKVELLTIKDTTMYTVNKWAIIVYSDTVWIAFSGLKECE